MKLWQKKYKVNKAVEKFTVGNDYILDQRLVKYDCLASMAHAKMLAKIGILSSVELKKALAGLNQMIDLDKKGKFKILPEDEDCHTAIENYLTKKFGAVGKKIHTARSRNDQVLTALRLYYRESLSAASLSVNQLIETLTKFEKKFGNIRMPGYTHTRKAMPSSVKLWTQCFIDSLSDDLKSLSYVQELINQSPLGTAAGYGPPLKIDRAMTAKLLGFDKVQKNPIYAQHSRGKFESAILHALTQIMFDFNKVSTDLIMFSMPEFGYFDLPKEFCTGSSIMPQKRNPDVFELLRAKYWVVISCEQQVRSIVGNLPSGYNRDFQLLKEPVFKAFDVVSESIEILTEVFKNLSVNKDNCKKAMTEELFATEEVYKLVAKGLPFRVAYKKISRKYN